MTALPIIRRELLVQARARATYHLRSAVGIVGLPSLMVAAAALEFPVFVSSILGLPFFRVCFGFRISGFLSHDGPPPH